VSTIAKISSQVGWRVDRTALVACLWCLCTAADLRAPAAERLPNVVLILADDLGYGDLGCYGQQVIETPRLDRMAAEGLRFTQFYAGSTVCAPSRCVLMTGRHTGHARVRGNGGTSIQSLRRDDVTIAELLKQAGYATALCGKWGLGDAHPGNEGLPNDQGFDYFFGYLNQTHAHNYYPDFLWRNSQQVVLPNTVTHLPQPDSPGGYATKKVAYSHDLVTEEAINFVRSNRDKPFFLFWAITIPHANNEARRELGDGQEVPDYGIYTDRAWPNSDKGHAAMITRMDAGVGRLVDTLQELGIDDDTLVLFSSDNGPHHEGGQDVQRFDPNGPLRGMKRDLYEGGIRVPMIARWPGVVPNGTVSDHIGYFGDVFATLAEIAKQPVPDGLDSLSFLPTLLGHNEQQQQHDYLYWEFYEQGSKQAVRWKDWKAVRMPMLTGRTELYDLASDEGENTDVATQHPAVARRLEGMMDEAHVPDPNWTPRR
jgi:arylsulfatase A-like enzyme